MKLTRVDFEEGAKGLSRCFEDISACEVLAWYNAGQVSFYRTDNGSYACIEYQPDALFVWAYEGVDCGAFAAAMIDEAAHRKLPFVRFNTTHKGLHRLIRNFAPRLVQRVNNCKTFEVTV